MSHLWRSCVRVKFKMIIFKQIVLFVKGGGWAIVAALFIVGCQNEPTVQVTRIVTKTVIASRPVEVTRLVIETIVEETVPTVPTADVASQPKHLVVCLSQEPEGLYWYGRSAQASRAVQHATRSVQHALFTDNWTTLDYAYQPLGITKMPSLADGDAALQEVTVAEGDAVMDANGNVVVLATGTPIVNHLGEVVLFEGTPTIMGQMAVTFTLQPRQWSDGTAVTADDSLYSFRLDADPNTPTSKEKVARTADYVAIDELTLRWRGVPGFYDRTYFTNLWQPLPRHAWQELTAAELLEADISNQFPVGDGPFVVEAWQPNEQIHLVRNPYYFQPSQPYLDSVTFRFVPSSDQLLAQLLTGECHIGTQDGLDINSVPFLLNAEASGLMNAYLRPGRVYEHIDFGINSYSTNGDNFARPDWFEDARVRRALTLCTDRQGMIEAISYGRSEVMHSYLPSVHPLFEADLPLLTYDPVQGRQLLDEAGYVDSDGDGIREFPGSLNGRFRGEPFVVTLATTDDNEMRQQIAERFQSDMQVCGVQVMLDFYATDEWYRDGAAGGILFGRRFELAGFAWLAEVEPACHFYISDAIPGPEGEVNPRHYAVPATLNGWDGNNNSGWANETFDVACRLGQSSLPGTAVYEAAHKEANQVFISEAPIIPLFSHLKVAATSPLVVGFDINATQSAELYNLYEIDLQQ